MIYISKGECIMNEIEKRKEMAMSLMDMELIPDMDEKNLVLQIWQHSELLFNR